MKKNHSSVLYVFTITVLIVSLIIPSARVIANSTPGVSYSPATVIHVPGDIATLQQALTSVPDGGIIELASGTYVSPSSDGWNLNNIYKLITIRAASGANVVLSGGGNHRIIRYQNTDPNSVKNITFDHITFSGGYSTAEGLSGGVTIYEGKATFVNCRFESNALDNSVNTFGGAMYIAGASSTVFIFNSVFTRNNAKSGGAAIGIRSQSKVYIHQSEFLSNNNGNLYSSSGGAINLGNATLRITNSRFDQNRAGLYGGAVYIIGNWTANSRTTPQADVIIANSLFTNNAATRDQTSSSTAPTEGGAINIEDQSLLRVYSSRFINNRSNIAGGINSYRSSVEVYGTTFLGNQADDTRGFSGFGGAISLNSDDTSLDSTDNKPNASLTLSNSWLQGRYGSTTTSAISGACLSVHGDNARLQDNDNVPNIGTVADNQAKVTVTQSVFYDCDTNPGADGSSASGAIASSLANFNFQNSIVANSDATTSNSMGGGVTLLYNTTANITQSTFAGNTAGSYGGGIFAQGSNVSVSSSKIFGNSNASYGSAIFSGPDEGRKINMTGSINNNTFSNNPGTKVVFDDDRNSAGTPYNDLQYNGNTFYKGTSTTDYWDSIGGGGSAAQLNALVVQRNKINVSTDKSPQNNNSDVQTAPILGSILAAPSYTLSNKAAGESSNPVAHVLYAWNGGSAQFNGSSLSSSSFAGASDVSAPGNQTLTVGSSPFTSTVSQRANPSATFTVSGTSPNYTLNWALQSGTFLDSAINQGVNTNHAASGSASVSTQIDNEYYLYIVTQEGGYLTSANTAIPIPVLSSPDTIARVVAQGSANKLGYLSIQNTGNGTLTWTASSLSPNLITINVTSGQLSENQIATIPFTINANGSGTYTGKIHIESNGGSKDISVRVVVASKVYTIMLTLIER